MPYYKISAWMRGIPKATAQLRSLDRYIKGDGREQMVRSGFNAAGDVFDRNFQNEGRMVGGWQGLAESTQNEREALGFGRAHPILIRYGDLRHATAAFLRDATGSETFSAIDEQGKSISVDLNIGRGSGSAKAYGDKAGNQTIRPYWFTTQTVTRAVRSESEEALDHGIAGLF